MHWPVLSWRRALAAPDHCSKNSIGYPWHLGSNSKLQLSPTKSLTQAYHLISPLNWATTILPVSFARLVPTSLHNHIRPLNLVPLLLNHVHPRSGTNCPSKLSPHNHSRLSRAGLKLTISVSHLPRSRASPRLRFVPYCSHELTVLDPGVFKLSLLLLLLLWVNGFLNDTW